MTMSEFDTLRADLAAMRTDMAALRTDMSAQRTEMDNRLVALRTDIDGRLVALRTDIDIRFARLESKLDEKPGVATIYQASLATFAGMFAVMIGTVVLLKSIHVLS
jgi:hypothetical protein